MAEFTAEDRARVFEIAQFSVTSGDGELIPTKLWGSPVLRNVRASDPELYERFTEYLVFSAASRFTKDEFKKRQTVKVGHGRTISRYVPIKQIDKDGNVVERQKLLEKLTITELEGVAEDYQKQIASLNVTVNVANNLRDLCIRHEVWTVEEALAKEGISIDEYLKED